MNRQVVAHVNPPGDVLVDANGSYAVRVVIRNFRTIARCNRNAVKNYGDWPPYSSDAQHVPDGLFTVMVEDMTHAAYKDDWKRLGARK